MSTSPIVPRPISCSISHVEEVGQALLERHEVYVRRHEVRRYTDWNIPVMTYIPGLEGNSSFRRTQTIQFYNGTTSESSKSRASRCSGCGACARGSFTIVVLFALRHSDHILEKNAVLEKVYTLLDP